MGMQHQSSTAPSQRHSLADIETTGHSSVPSASHSTVMEMLIWGIKSPNLVTSFSHCPPMGQEEWVVAIAMSITVPVGEGVRGRLLVGQWQTEPNMAFHTLPWAVAHLVPARNQGNWGECKKSSQSIVMRCLCGHELGWVNNTHLHLDKACCEFTAARWLFV